MYKNGQQDGKRMNKNLKKISKNITGGIHLEESIPSFFNHLVTEYHTYGSMELAMHYYSFYEAYCDNEHVWSDHNKETIKNVNCLVRDHIVKASTGERLEKAVAQIDSIRNEIISRMHVIAAYTDVFMIYEYVLNRVEYRFKGDIKPLDDQEFTREILQYIFDSEDNFIINENIKEIIGQLPVRITRQKYFDLLKDSIKAYQGAERDTLDTFLYLIRTSAMLHMPKNMEEYYPKLWEMKEKLSSLSYKEISKEEYEEASTMLRVASLMLETENFVYYNLQEIVNDVYVLLLSSNYTGMVENPREKQEEASFNIIKEINKAFFVKEKKELPDALIQHFAIMEGVLEEVSGELIALEEVLDLLERDYKQLISDLFIDKLFQALLRCNDLLSSSIFIEFHEHKDHSTVDEALAEKEADTLINDLARIFKELDRAITRAIMGNTLNKIPVFFKNRTEVMEYILYSLDRCTDTYEKAACAEIIQGIMEEN